MSGIAGIFNIPGNPQQFAAWSFNHAVHHVEINQAIERSTATPTTLGTIIPSYILDPFDPSDPASFERWLYQHQAMHQSMDAILGIKGYDLTTGDWEDPGSLAGWIQSNANEHLQAADILEIG